MVNMPGPVGSIKRRLRSGAAWVVANRILVVFFGLATNMLLARLLTPASMGAYFLVANVVIIAGIVAQLGLTRVVVRLVAESLALNNPARAGAAIRICLLLGFAGSSVIAALISSKGGHWLAEAVFDSSLMKGVMGIAGLWVLIQTMQRLLGETFRGLHDLRLAAIFGGIVSGALTVSFLLYLTLVYGQANLQQVLVLSVTALGISGLLAGTILSIKIRPLKGHDALRASEIMTIAWPLLFATVTNILITRADVWVLGMLRPEEEVALYGAAARLIIIVATPLTMASAVLAPIISELNAQQAYQRLERILRATATVVALPAILVIATLMFFDESIMALVFGEYYRPGGNVLIILGFGHLITVMAGAAGLLLTMTGHQQAVMWISLLSACLAIVISAFAGERYGMLGVAFGFSLGLSVQSISLFLYSFLKLKINTLIFLNPGSLMRLRNA